MNIIDNYLNGSASGWAGKEMADAEYPSVRATANFLEFVPLSQDAGAPRYSVNYQVMRKLLGKDLVNIAQEIGDCFIAGTRVRMADGTEKVIEDVAVGDLVVTHRNRVRRVDRVIRKPYSGDLVTLHGKGMPRAVTSTPDHRFVRVIRPRDHRSQVAEFVWQPSGETEVGHNVLAPSCLGTVEEHAFTLDDGRKVSLDSRLGRFLGLYLAEGSLDNNQQGNPTRVRFSFGRHEDALVAEVVAAAAELFGNAACVHNLPSKPTVTLVDVNDAPVARLLAELVPGNVYTKRVPPAVRASADAVRLACVKGWIDGDGHHRVDGANGGFSAKALGVSVSPDLLTDMYELCLSVGLKPNVNWRKARAGRQPAGQVCVYGEAALQLYPEHRQEAEASKKRKPWASRSDMTELGLATPVDRVSREQVRNIEVFCLEVAEDHSFVANGYAVHNCVSWGGRNAAAFTGFSDILVRGDSEKFSDPYAPFYYGTSRVQIGGGRLGNSDGSLGSWLAAAVMKYGTIYADTPGVPTYSGSVAKSWGLNGPPREMLSVGANFLIRSAVRITSWAQLVEYVVNGYGVTIASNRGFTMEPDASGFHRASGTWAHQMCFFDIDDEWSDPYVLIRNSWADVHGRLKDFRTGDPLPIGTIRAHRRDAESMIQSGECFAFTQYDQPKSQDIHERLFKVI